MEQLRAVTRLVTDIAGPDLVGIYLHGSSVLGPCVDEMLAHIRRLARDHGLDQ